MEPHFGVLNCFVNDPIFFNYYLRGSFSMLLVVVLALLLDFLIGSIGII